MASLISRESAQALVRRIAKDHGYLGDDVLQRIKPDLRRQIEEAFLKKDLMIGNSVITLAKNLYTNKARFVFELLQNADDNLYQRARSKGAEPYVSFQVHPQKIVIECNEDGFTEKNLEAICSVGKSSKTGAQGYIGEKGIGFKSVFMAAWKVHIQSGAFSFSFTHRRGDSGMGMISPVWEDARDDALAPLLTRITLHLHEAGDADADVLANTRRVIHEQFQELQDTMLLFLKNLRRIRVSFHAENGGQTSCTTYSVEKPKPNYAVLRKVSGAAAVQTKHFHVTTYEATGLAKNENRTYSPAEEAARAYSKSEIVLAFPLSPTSLPIVQPQDLFVFLPVRSVGFNFIIQADFVTDASRQDIVQHSFRNVGLLDGIAAAFVQAVLQFCEHPTLRYQWMRYLPKKTRNRDTLWTKLVGNIAQGLARTRILFGHKKHNKLRRMSGLLRLKDDLLDEHGQPLLDDGEPDQVVSRRYATADLDRLCEYGLEYAKFSDFAGWLSSDLQRGAQSRMKSARTTANWHARVSQYLCRAFDEKPIGEINSLKHMPLLPLSDGTWVSASSGPVYWPQSHAIDIPPDLDLQLVANDALSAPRKSLFRHLGVTTAPTSLVRQKILGKYPKVQLPQKLSLGASKRHLEFLYLTEHLESGKASYWNVAIHTSQETLDKPHYESMFVANDEPYGPYELCKKTEAGSGMGCGAPGFPLVFVNDAYFKDPPTQPGGQSLTWLEWFYEKLDVEKYIDLEDSPGDEIRDYIKEYRPEKFLGAVRQHHENKGEDGFDAGFVDILAKTAVLCRGEEFWKLEDTYFPTAELEKRVKRYLEPGALFPWLWLDEQEPSSPETVPLRWKGMLSAIQKERSGTDVEFALDMLRYAVDGFPSKARAASRTRLFSLYEHIYAKYWESERREVEAADIRATFSSENRIYIPTGPDTCSWALPEECVWESSIDLTSYYSLRHLYMPCLNSGGMLSSFITHLFTDILKIPNSGWQTYVSELEHLKQLRCKDAGTITKVYEALGDLWSSMSSKDRESLKAKFEADKIIFVPSKQRDGSAWYKTSQCVWSSAARLRGRVSLNDDYANLKMLFVGFLGVMPVDLSMAIDELAEAASRPSTSVSEIKESIWAVNSLLSAVSNPEAAKQIDRNLDIFPVIEANGSITRMSAESEFFAVDHEPLRQAFDKKVRFLDFSLKETAQLAPFLIWMRLENRCLSRCVAERTSFSGGGATLALQREKQIQNRAYALLRIATHYSSPRTTLKSDMDLFYEVLRNVKVYETDGISSDFQLVQDKIPIAVAGRKTTLHIEECSQAGSSPSVGVKIYVPRDRDDQEYTFTSSLPKKLFVWMMKSPLAKAPEKVLKSGIEATKSILMAPVSRMSLALDDSGISSIDVVNIDDAGNEETEYEQGGLGAARHTIPATPQRNRRGNRGSVDSTPSEQGEDYFSDSRSSTGATLTPSTSVGTASPASSALLTPSRSSRRPATFGWSFLGGGTISAPRPPSPNPAANENRKYVALLSRAISAARQQDFPGRGLFGMSDLSASLPVLGNAGNDALDFGLRSLGQFERDCRVGAAGELYVFELLSHVTAPGRLSNFSRANWQSTIRKYVTAHPDYADMEPWTGRETSDIVYPDSQGNLTDLLVETGYLDRSRWGRQARREQVTYYIEVKTTTLSCEAPFYMSKAQYQRMRDNTIPDDRSSTNKNIYVIFRVFNLGRENMCVRIYVDPEKLRLDETLKFTAESWSVVPR